MYSCTKHYFILDDSVFLYQTLFYIYRLLKSVFLYQTQFYTCMPQDSVFLYKHYFILEDSVFLYQTSFYIYRPQESVFLYQTLISHMYAIRQCIPIPNTIFYWGIVQSISDLISHFQATGECIPVPTTLEDGVLLKQELFSPCVCCFHQAKLSFSLFFPI